MFKCILNYFKIPKQKPVNKKRKEYFLILSDDINSKPIYPTVFNDKYRKGYRKLWIDNIKN